MFGGICILLLIFLVSEPVRGSADGARMVKKSNYFADVAQVLNMSVESTYFLLSLSSQSLFF